MTRKIRAFVRAFARGENGIAAIEFAIVFPVMVLMYFGMLDLTSFITNNRRVMYAASITADLVTANESSVLGTQVSDYYNAADMILNPVPPAKIRVELFDYKTDGSLRWSLDNGRGSSCGAAPVAASFSSMTNATQANDVLVARVCTEYKPFFGTFMGSTLLGTPVIKLVKTIYQRPRLTKDLKCYLTTSGGTAC
jgi:TadE-like protein